MNSPSTIRLVEVLQPVSRPESVVPTRAYDLLGAHWYAKGLYVKESKQGSEIQADTVYRVEEGDFVYNRLFAWKGSFALASKEDHGCYVSNEFPCFQIDPAQVDPKYLAYYFAQESSWNRALGLSSGGTPTSRNRLKEARFLEMEIPIRSLQTQAAIVSRIEELALRIQDARTLRYESAKEVAALLSSRTSEAFEDVCTRFPARPIRELGKNGSNPVQTGPFGAQLHSSEFVDHGVPVLNVGNVWPEGLRFDRVDHVLLEKARQLSRYSLKAGDLLFARSGATLGKVCLVPQECDGWLMTGHLFRVRFDHEVVSSRFAFSALRGARMIREQVFGQVRGATRPGYNTTLLGNVELPLPPLVEQHQIVHELEALQATIGPLKQLQAETAAELDALLPAVLSQAFNGEL